MSSAQPNWKSLIAEMVYIRQAMADADSKGLWEYALPAVAASTSQVRAVEQQLGYPLDESYRQFLLHANGWPSIYQAVDLFGTDELVGGPQGLHADEAISHLDTSVLEQSGVSRESVLPIAVSRHDLDVFVLSTPTSSRPGEVIWFAGSEIDRFRNFHEYFLAMEDYNRMEVQALKASSS